MKIIQSCWTKPFLQLGDSLKDTRLNGGWPARKYNYFSWALSCLQLRKYYKDVELVTDDLGSFLLIEKMKLPYSKVTLELNRLDDYNSGLWALGKALAYSIQETPFLHVDNDVFIWNAFEDHIEAASLVAQNIENTVEGAAQTFNEVCSRFHHIPDCLKELEGSKHIQYSNAGVLGGTDVSFFRNYTSEIFTFIHENQESINEHIEDLNLAYVNVIYEQILFNQLAKGGGNHITHLFPDVTDIPRAIGFFHESKNFGGYMHCSGTFKKSRLIYELLEIKLKTLYPDYYELIVDHVESSEI
ncbi:MAG TPA: DUF6734 family protein [Puia sp.]|nr:DUF6734 family protein [Puia sp.]